VPRKLIIVLFSSVDCCPHYNQSKVRGGDPEKDHGRHGSEPRCKIKFILSYTVVRTVNTDLAYCQPTSVFIVTAWHWAQDHSDWSNSYVAFWGMLLNRWWWWYNDYVTELFCNNVILTYNALIIF